MENRRSDFQKRVRDIQKMNEKPQPKPKPSNFVPYSTMFKLEEPPRPENEADITSRVLVCVSCGRMLEWRIYSVAPDKMDAECPMCHVKACDFWKEKSHKELDADA